MRVIGDVHGKYREYLEIIKDVDYSFQLGDFGFYYDFLKGVNALKHRFGAGNHDNHDDLVNWSHWIGKYGPYSHGWVQYFWVGGGYSIDQEYRRKKERLMEWPKTWWDNEELTQDELDEAIELYEEFRPEIMISHEAPRSVVSYITDGRVLKDWGFDPDTFTTRTSEALQKMFEIHQPKRWIFGHFHRSVQFEVNGTNFRCLKELEYIDL